MRPAGMIDYNTMGERTAARGAAVSNAALGRGI